MALRDMLTSLGGGLVSGCVTRSWGGGFWCCLFLLQWLNSLRKALDKLKNKADVDSAGIEHDRRLHPINSNPPGSSYPRWDGSAAQRLLKEDIEEGEHKQLQPRELRMTREEYQVFPLHVFRKHIHQEVRSRTETPYWLVKKQQKRGP